MSTRRKIVLAWVTAGGCCGFPLLSAVLFLKGCGEPKTTEIERISNPLRTVDALVLSDYYDEGATGFHQDFRVLLVPHGARAEEKDSNLVLILSDAEGYGKEGNWTPEWEAGDKLLLRFKRAHVTQYDNEPWPIGGLFVGVRLEVARYGGHGSEGGLSGSGR